MPLATRVIDLLDRPIAFHSIFIKLGGSVNAGLLLSQAFYWTRRTKNGWFYKTQAEWTTETYLTRSEQESARRLLRQTDFWQEKRSGTPAKLYYRVNLDALEAALLIAGIPQSKNAENLQSTTETTTEITSEEPPNPPKGGRGGSGDSPSAKVREVFQHWQTVLNHPQAKLDAKRQRAIQARLRDYTVGDLKRAIEGCRASSFHMGDNETGTIHDDISLICRDATHVEMFMERLNQKPFPVKDATTLAMEAMGLEWKPKAINTPEDYWSPECGETLEEVRAKWNTPLVRLN